MDKPSETIKKEVQQVPKRTLVARIPLFQIILGVLILSFAILAFSVKLSPPYFNFDLIITRFIQSYNAVWFDWLMRVVSTMGNVDWGTGLIFFTAVVLAVLKKGRDALMVFISSIGISLLSVLLKQLVGRPRPDPELITQIGNFLRNDSFPSGHVLHAIGLYGFLLFLAYSGLKQSTLRTALIIFFLLIIILMGISRIYLGAHWFSDTLGSYLIGTAWLFIMVYIYRKFLK